MILLDGEPCTAHGLATALSRLAHNLTRERQFSRCPTCEGYGRDDDGNQCPEREPGIIVDVEWSACPYGMLTTPWWHAMIRLDHARRLSPLHGWPDAYSHATVTAMLALDTAEKERIAAEQEKARRKQGGR